MSIRTLDDNIAPVPNGRVVVNNIAHWVDCHARDIAQYVGPDCYVTVNGDPFDVRGQAVQLDAVYRIKSGSNVNPPIYVEAQMTMSKDPDDSDDLLGIAREYLEDIKITIDAQYSEV